LTEKDLIEVFFQKLELNWHIFKNRYQTNTFKWKWVSSNEL